MSISKRGIYIASKTKHAPKWRALRANGIPIISTWIDEAGEGETSDYADLWCRCISESKNAAALILYVEEGDVLKGAYVEMGAAVGAGVPVFAVGPIPMSFVEAKLVKWCNLGDAFKYATELANRENT